MTSPTPHPVHAQHEHPQLIDGCLHCVNQCESLLRQLSAADYVDSRGGASVGAHMRHVLERFRSFFEGLPGGLVDYDARARDRGLETSLEMATRAVGELRNDIMRLDLQAAAGIRVHESVSPEAPAITVASTVPRELMSLITHTIHHLAIIALLVKPLGFTPDANFGKAASTIRYERKA